VRKYTLVGANKLPMRLPGEHPVKVAPFAGKYPTRVLVAITYQGKKKAWLYFGKPNATVFKKIRHAWTEDNTVRSVLVKEIDRKNMLREFFAILPKAYAINFRGYADTNALRYYYAYGSLLDPWRWLNVKHYLKHVTLKGKKHFVYSGLEKVKMAEHVLPYKKWVEAEALVL